MTKRVSRAEIRRQREGLLRARSEAPSLPRELAERAERFTPSSVDDEAWVAVRPLFLAVIGCSSARGAVAFKERCIALAAFLAWADSEGVELSVPSLMRFEVIDEYVRSLSTSGAATRRSHLRSLARDANPAGIPPVPLRYPHITVKEPYSEPEMAAIRRVALTQPTPIQRRSMCAVVGLGRGAGLDSRDFRFLTGGDVDDRGGDGIWVEVRGPRPRLVPVRRRWEDLVRVGLDGLGSESLVIGSSASRRNIVAKIVEGATVLGDAPKIEAGRLRTTWLADLLASDVPLTVVMAVSGLRSARTITEILTHLDGGADPGVAR